MPKLFERAVGFRRGVHDADELDRLLDSSPDAIEGAEVVMVDRSCCIASMNRRW
jgi:hypothetical protein